MEGRGQAERQRSAAGNRKQSLGGQLATGAACVSAIIAVLAAYSAFAQIDIAKSQNEIADRQSLSVIVADITQQKRVLEKTKGVATIVVEEAMLADAEEALALVDTLKASVPAVDNYEIGAAFEASGDYYNALRSFRRATQTESDPHYRASSWRGEAKIWYTLAGPTNIMRARVAVARAYHSYDGQPDVPRLTIESNEAFTDLFAAGYEAPSDCQRARERLSAGEQLVHADPATITSVAEVALKYAEHTTAQCG
jgi:hypothetical protein